MEYQAISELTQLTGLEMVLRALLLGSLLVFVLAVGIVFCLCLFVWRLTKRSGRPASSLEVKPFLPMLAISAALAMPVHTATVWQSEPEAGKSYPDFALQPPSVNTSPGPEYAASTRVYQGIPGIERTAKGHLWAAWTAGRTGEGPHYVVVVASGDDGKSWSEPKLVIDPPGNVLAWCPTLWGDPRGRLWLFWSQGYGTWDGRGGVWAMVSDHPDDANPRWTRPRRLADGVAMNKPTVLSTGEWILPIAVWTQKPTVSELNVRNKLGLSPAETKALSHDLGEEKGSNVYRSVDQGKSWKLLGQARVPETDCDEHMIVERKDGSLWMLVRTRYGIGQSISTDRGRTWGQSGESGIRHPVTRFFIRRLNSGRLLMVRHNPPGQPNRSHLTAYLSDDDGRSWYGNLLLDERDSVSYPDGVEAPNGDLYVIYDQGGSRRPPTGKS
jgi:predicted neuraminidase